MRKSIFCWLFIISFFYLPASIQEIAFKEYDIRGIVGQDFSEADTYDLALAIGTYLLEKDSSIQKIIVGADGRIHSPAIKKNIMQALVEMGFDVLDIGTCTTPVVCFGLHTLPVDAGLMITASHNPGEYNGLKIYHGTTCVSGTEIKKIGEIYRYRELKNKPEKDGCFQTKALIPGYVSYLKQLFPHLIGSDIHAIIDCGNGAAGTVLPLLLQEMQWKHVSLLYPEVDGTYPHHIADPTVEKYMQDLKEKLSGSKAVLGLGLDGDCDRMAPMTRSGRLIKGDQLLALFSKNVLKNYPGSTVVFDISSSHAAHEDVKRFGGNPVLSTTGASQIKRKMLEIHAFLGGEISCHTFFKDRYFGFDDGIYSMMRLFELLKETRSSLDELLSELTPAFSSPTYRIPCSAELCLTIIESLKEHFRACQDAELTTIDGLRVDFPYGWAIVRASKTEPVISIRFEGNTEENLLRLKREFYKQINFYLTCPSLLD